MTAGDKPKPQDTLATQRRRAEHRLALAAKAAVGDTKASLGMIQHAMAAARAASVNCDAADGFALRWIADALGKIIAGDPAGFALGVESNRPGAPKTPPLQRYVFESVPINDEVERLASKLRVEGVLKPIEQAVAKVAASRGISPSKVREARAAVARIKRAGLSADEQTDSESGPIV